MHIRLLRLQTLKLNEPIIVLADLIADKKNAQEVYSRIEALYAEGIAVYGKDVSIASLSATYLLSFVKTVSLPSLCTAFSLRSKKDSLWS